MTFLENALKLLRRPVESAGEPQGRRKAGAPRETDALTEAELVDVIASLQNERQDAETTLAGAADRREDLLMQPGSDDEILSLAQSIDRANLTLERLDRLEPDLRRRLGEVRFYNRGARWVADRDRAAAAFETFVEAIDAYQKARGDWAVVWDGMIEKWSDAGEIMPVMPRLDGGSASYRDHLEEFKRRIIVLKEPPRPLYRTMANAIDYAKKFGRPPDGLPADWAAECEAAIADSVSVRLLVSSLDDNGQAIAKGAVVSMSYDEAQRAVTSGRATFADL